jgi:uncharacterized membrane protein
MKISGFSLKDNNNGYVVAVAVALIIAVALLATFYVTNRPPQQSYTSIYLLDTQGKAVEYPEVVVANQNSTFSVFVTVENHRGASVDATVYVKVISGTPSALPVNGEVTQTFNGEIKNGATWKNTSTLTLNTPGQYTVVCELWLTNSTSGELQFSGNACTLPVQVA